MRFRKLRIVWSVAWGLAAVLLIALWVRSYWRVEHLLWNGETKAVDVSSYPGQVSIQGVNDRVMMPLGWCHVSFPVSEEDFEEDADSDALSMAIFGFRLEVDDDSVTAYMPFWFPILMCTAAALSAYVTPPLFKRFSLRTLLIATTLIAVALGLIGWLIK